MKKTIPLLFVVLVVLSAAQARPIRDLRQNDADGKPLLLNQRFLAGLGNIYVDEALFQAHIHPERKADTLTGGEIAALYRAIQTILQESIASLGTSFDPIYSGGLRESAATYQNYLRVYQRTGESCPRCGQTIERITVGGRGTHLCSRCQQKDAL